MSQEITKIVVYPNGDIIDVDKTRETLFKYWQLSKAEKRAFDRLCGRSDLKEKYLKELKNE